MKNIAWIAALTLTLSGAAPLKAEVRLADVIEVLGDVSEPAGPVENALVVAFNLSNSYIIQTFSGKKGQFQLPPLPSGVYRIIAVKQGFAPAVATVTPSRRAGRTLSLRLRAPGKMSRSDRDAIWEARRAIPSDILRELNIIDESIGLIANDGPTSRFGGQMVSTTGIGQAEGISAFTRTAVDVQGRVGGAWVVELSGSVQTMDDEAIYLPSGALEPVAEAADVSMRLRSGADSSYHLDSARNSWIVEASGEPARMADFESHNFEWRRRNANVHFRYLAHENLFHGSRFASELFELEAESRLVDGERSELGVTLRVGQESLIGKPLAMPLRTADLATRGSYDIIPALAIRYGVQSRLSEYGQEWAPETGFLLKLTPGTSLLVHGSYKLEDLERPLTYPAMAFVDQPWRFAPRYHYSIALQSGTSEASRLVAKASVAEIDSVLRIVFEDRFEEFWDAFYLEPGDVYQAVSFGLRRQLGDSLSFDLETRAGQAANDVQPEWSKHFVSGSVQSLYIPSGTAVHLAYRLIEQPDAYSALMPQESERINVRVAQSLGLPLGLRLLLGVDLARSMNSLVLADEETIDGYHRRLVGGLSLEF